MAEGSTGSKPTGKTFNFNLVGDDLFLYETLRDIYEGEAEEAEAKVSEALASLDPAVRALVQERMAAKASRKELSHRQVFSRALQEALAARDAAEDARIEASDDDASEGDDHDAE